MALARAKELGFATGNKESASFALAKLAQLHMFRGEFKVAVELGRSGVEIAPDTQSLRMAHGTLGRILLLVGECREVIENLERALSLPETRSFGIFQPLPTFRHAGLLLFLGNALWLRGFLDQARQRNREALQSARESRNLAVLAAVFAFAAEYFIWTGEQDRLRESVDAFQAVQAELEPIVGLPDFMEVRKGWLLIERGEVQEGIKSIRSGIANLHARNVSMYSSFHTALLALAYKRANQIDDAFASIDDALRFVEQSGERFYEAELHRLRGEWLLAYGRASATGEIEGCFRKAVEIARKQEAKSWELRATTSLARLMRDTNCRDEARAMLAHIYNWFTEGFETPDLKEAKALLEQLRTQRLEQGGKINACCFRR